MTDVYLHVGPMKTGSTFLQAVMWNNRAKLLEQGLLLPADHDNEFFLAANDVQSYRFAAIDYPEAKGLWDKVAARAMNWPGRVLISHEILGISEPDHIARIARSLEPSTVQIVLMARCLADLLPSVYQEKVKQVSPHESWSDFVEHARPGGADHWVQDVGRIIERWLCHVEPNQIHVITVPRRGTPTEVLLARFTAVLGVERDGLSLDGVEVNAAMDAVDVRLLQILIAQTASTHSLRQRRLLVERHVVPALRQVSRSRRPLRVPAALRAAMLEESQRQIEAILAARCQIHGNLDELIPDDHCFASAASSPEDVSAEELLSLVIEAWVNSLAADRRGPGDTAPVR